MRRACVCVRVYGHEARLATMSLFFFRALTRFVTVLGGRCQSFSEVLVNIYYRYTNIGVAFGGGDLISIADAFPRFQNRWS